MDWLFFVILVTGIFNLGIALRVYIKNPSKVVNKSFGLFVLFLTLWAISIPLLQKTKLLIISDFITLNAILAIAFFTFFSLVFPYNITKKSYYLIFLFPLVLISLLPLRLFIKSAIFYENGEMQPVLGKLFFLISVFAAIYIAGGIFLLVKKYKKTSGDLRLHFFYVLLGGGIFVIGGALFDAILPGFGYYKLVPYGPLFTIILTGFIAYAIMAHQLFDIKLVIKRSALYLILITVITIVYSLIAAAFLFFMQEREAFLIIFRDRALVPIIIASIFISLTYDRLKKYFQTLTDKWLFQGQHSPEDLLKLVAVDLNSSLDLSEACHKAIERLFDFFHTDRGFCFQIELKEEINVPKINFYGKAKKVYFQGKQNKPTEFPAGSIILDSANPLFAYLASREYNIAIARERIIIREEIERGILELEPKQEKLRSVAEVMKMLEMQILVPILSNEKLIGALMLGDKKSGDPYSYQDISLLEGIATELASAIERARFFKEDKEKNEFISIAAHELGAPVLAVRSYLSMILFEGKGKINKEAREYLTQANESIGRISRLTNDFSDISKLESGAIDLTIVPIDPETYIEKVVDQLSVLAKEKNVTIEYKKAKLGLPLIDADQQKFIQILVNLISNAIKFNKEKGKVQILAEKDGDSVKISIADSGMGIASDDLEHIFSKFYRAKSAVDKSVAGSGLGLYITRGLIEIMGGKITAQSELGEGSIFTFWLPITKEKRELEY